MPNWVTNTLTITASPEVIAQMKAQLSAPFEQTHYNFIKDTTETVKVEQPFSFWNIIKPTDLDAYHDAKDKPQEGPDHWYSWNLRNWGTKWDVRDVTTHEQSDTELSFGFDTAWSPPVTAIETLAEQYPSATLKLDYTEEQGWGGTVEFEDGMGVETDSYEYKCWECDERYQSYDEAEFDEESGEHLCKEVAVNA
jgi:hypothetical protein